MDVCVNFLIFIMERKIKHCGLILKYIYYLLYYSI